jgi:hypothetical protein
MVTAERQLWRWSEMDFSSHFVTLTSTAPVLIIRTSRHLLYLTRHRLQLSNPLCDGRFYSSESSTTLHCLPRHAIHVVYLFIGVIGCTTNAFVLFVLVSAKKSLGSTVNIFIINQTFLDMLACFLVSIGNIVILAGVTKFSLPLCILVGGGVTTMSAANAATMSLVIGNAGEVLQNCPSNFA